MKKDLAVLLVIAAVLVAAVLFGLQQHATRVEPGVPVSSSLMR